MAQCSVTGTINKDMIYFTPNSDFRSIPKRILEELRTPGSLLLDQVARASLLTLPEDHKSESSYAEAVSDSKDTVLSIFRDPDITFSFVHCKIKNNPISFAMSVVEYDPEKRHVYLTYVSETFKLGHDAITEGQMYDSSKEDKRRTQQGMMKLPPVLTAEQALAGLRLVLQVTTLHELAHHTGGRVNKEGTPPRIRASTSKVKKGERGQFLEELKFGGPIGVSFRVGQRLNWRSVCGLYVQLQDGKRPINPLALDILVDQFETLTPEIMGRHLLELTSPHLNMITKFRSQGDLEDMEVGLDSPLQATTLADPGMFDESLVDMVENDGGVMTNDDNEG